MTKHIVMTALFALSLPVAAAAQTVPPPPPTMKVFLSVNGGYQVTSNDFGDGADFRANAEDGRFDTDYTVAAGPAFDVAGGLNVWRRLAVGVGVSRYARTTSAVLNGTVPHPFFFSRPRTVNGEVSGLKRQELAIHVQARTGVPVGNRLQVTVFGGPSYFQVEQDVVTSFVYSDAFPYDTASFERAETTRAKESKLGFNVGGDVAFFFTRQLGLGFSAQFAGVNVDVPSADGGTRSVKAGGLQAGGGLRVRF